MFHVRNFVVLKQFEMKKIKLWIVYSILYVATFFVAGSVFSNEVHSVSVGNLYVNANDFISVSTLIPASNTSHWIKGTLTSKREEPSTTRQIVNAIAVDTTLASITLQLKESTIVKTAAIKFLATATLGLDVGYDAGAYQEGVPTFGINTHLVADSKNIDFTLQVLPDDSYEGMIIPIAVYAESGKTIGIQAIASNLPDDVNLFIEDKKLNTFTKVDQQSAYEVTLSSALSGIGRFYLRTSSKASLAVDEVSLSGVNMFITENNTLKISGVDSGKNASITLYCILGKKVFSSTFFTNGPKEIRLPNTLKKGVYISKLKVTTGQVFTKKIIVK